jgi:hypothetical protein
MPKPSHDHPGDEPDEQEESWGPKVAEVADNTAYDSSKRCDIFRQRTGASTEVAEGPHLDGGGLRRREWPQRRRDDLEHVLDGVSDRQSLQVTMVALRCRWLIFRDSSPCF